MFVREIKRNEMNYQLTNFSDSNFAEKTEKINKNFGGVASVVRIKSRVRKQEQTSQDSCRVIPAGTEVSACYLTGQYWEFCKDYVLKNCKIKVNPLTK